jgi:vitamin B12/bleomycin/antimicrobial peptide transport system ATP-binding/permease protein
MLLIVLNSLVTLIAFIGVLWMISGTLVVILVTYALAGTAISIVIGRKLVRLYYHQYEQEANFRYGLVRVRDNAESIAFYRGEKREHLDLFRRLAAALGNMRLIIILNRNLGFFTNSYNYLALVLPVLVVAPIFMRGGVEFGVITQTAGAFAQVLAAFSLIITQFGGLSAYLASIQRLGRLWDQLDEDDSEELRIYAEAESVPSAVSRILKLEQLTICTPGRGRVLVKELSFELHAEQSLMIMGPSGSGKSSVLRTIAGLWPGGGGSLERPAFNQLMFLPQRPYMVEGSLREQLLYPYGNQVISDTDIGKVLADVNLADVFERVDGDLDCVLDWGNVLSLGEQQRIAFARLFLRMPKFAFLDEATSALDEENQRELYQRIRDSGISFISVGHRTTLVEFHDRILELDRSGTWEIHSSVIR